MLYDSYIYIYVDLCVEKRNSYLKLTDDTSSSGFYASLPKTGGYIRNVSDSYHLVSEYHIFSVLSFGIKFIMVTIC